MTEIVHTSQSLSGSPTQHTAYTYIYSSSNIERPKVSFRKREKRNQTAGRSARNSCSHAESHEQKETNVGLYLLI